MKFLPILHSDSFVEVVFLGVGLFSSSETEIEGTGGAISLENHLFQ